MKRIIFVIVLFISIAAKNTECQCFLSYSMSGENNNVYHSIGYEILFTAYDAGNYNISSFGIFSKAINDPATFNFKYNFYLIPVKGTNLYCTLGPGININLGKKSGISPQIDLILNMVFFKLNASYIYNNSHEFGFTISTVEIIGTLIYIRGKTYF